MSTKATELAATITGDAKRLLAELETIKVQLRGLGKEAKNVGNDATSANTQAGVSFDKLTGKADKVAKGVAGITNALYAMEAQGSARILAIGNSVGNLVGLLGPQGKLVQGATIAGTAIVALFMQAKEKSAEATKAMEDDINRLVDTADLSSVRKRMRELDIGTVANEGRDGIQAAKQRVAQLERERDLYGEMAEKANVFADVQRNLNAKRDTERRLAKEREALAALTAEFDKYHAAHQRIENYNARIAGRDGRGELPAVSITANSTTRTQRELSEQLQKLEQARLAARALLDSVSDAGPVQQAARQIDAWTESAKKAGVSASEITATVQRLRKELGKLGESEAAEVGAALEALAAQSTMTALDDLEVTLRRSRSELERLAERAESSGTADGLLSARRIRSETIPALEQQHRQLAELTAMTERYAAANREAAKMAGVKGPFGIDVGALLALASAGKEIEEITAKLKDPALDPKIRAQLEDRLMALQNQRLAVQNKTVELEKSSALHLQDMATKGQAVVQALLPLAQLFGGIEGDIAKALQGISQMLGGVQSLAGAAEKAGGFKALFSGAALAKNPVALLSGVGAVVGGLAVIGNAIGLFGKDSREKARELHEAAIAWNRALEDFAIQTRTSLEESLRDNRRRAEQSTVTAAAAVGVKLKAPITVNSAADLEHAIAYYDSKGSTKARAFADELRKLLATFEENERELEKRNAAEIASLTENLEVRRLAVRGLGDEAEALRVRLALDEEIADLQARYGDAANEYIASLRDVTEQELAAAAAAKHRAQVYKELDDTLDILGGTGLEQLKTTIASLKKLFPELGTMFDDLALDTREGLETAKTLLQDWFREIKADDIPDSEQQPAIDAIKRILSALGLAFGELPDIVDPIAQALELFAIRTEVFGLNAREQLDELLKIFGGFDEQLSGLLTTVDTGSPEELERFAQGIRDQIAAILADGEITDAEAPLLAALQQLLGAAVGSIDEIARKAQEEADRIERERQERVRSVRTRAQRENELFGVTGADAVRNRFRADASLSPVLADLLPGLDDTSAEGIERTRQQLQQLFRDLEAGKIPLEQFGDLTKDEIIDAILALNGDLDDLAAALGAAAKAAAEAAAAERRATDDLRIRELRAKGVDTRLEEFDLDAKRQLEEALGKSDAYIAYLKKVLADERSKLIADLAAEAAEAAEGAEAATKRTRASSAQRTISTQIGGVTEISVQTWNSYLRQIVENTGKSANTESAMLSVLSKITPAGPIPVPAIPPSMLRPASYGGGGPTTVIIEQLNFAAPIVQLPLGGTISPAAAQSMGTAIGHAQVRGFAEMLGKLTNVDVKAIGGNKR